VPITRPRACVSVCVGAAHQHHFIGREGRTLPFFSFLFERVVFFLSGAAKGEKQKTMNQRACTVCEGISISPSKGGGAMERDSSVESPWRAELKWRELCCYAFCFALSGCCF
jgi:hypothetical protein